MLRNKKPRLPGEEGAVFVRLCCRDANPALPLFSAAGTVLHKISALTSGLKYVFLYV